MGSPFYASAGASGIAWPEFRGPTGQGISRAHSLPIHWAPDSSNQVWKKAIPGFGWSSPVIESNRLYLTTAVMGTNSAARSLRILCLNFATGQSLWETEVFSVSSAARIHNKNSYASPTPVLADNRVYVHFGPDGTACLDLDGRVIWKNNELKFPPVHGGGGSPIVVEDLLVFNCDGAEHPFIAALDRSSGRVRWKTARTVESKRKFSFSTPLAIRVGGRTQILSAASGALFAYDPKEGRELWRFRYGDGYSVVPRPIYGNGLVYISSGFDRPEVLAIRPDGSGDVTETHLAWKWSKGAPNTPSLLLDGSALYFVSDGGIATCLDALTGKLRWSERVNGNYSASPILADGRIYLQSEEGVGVVLKSGTEFEVLARNDLKERTLASPAAVDGSLLIRTETSLYRFDGDR